MQSSSKSFKDSWGSSIFGYRVERRPLGNPSTATASLELGSFKILGRDGEVGLNFESLPPFVAGSLTRSPTARLLILLVCSLSPSRDHLQAARRALRIHLNAVFPTSDKFPTTITCQELCYAKLRRVYVLNTAICLMQLDVSRQVLNSRHVFVRYDATFNVTLITPILSHRMRGTPPSFNFKLRLPPVSFVRGTHPKISVFNTPAGRHGKKPNFSMEFEL